MWSSAYPPPSCEKLFSLYPQCLNKISFGCSAAIQMKLLNYYIQSSCRCYTHSTILSYKSLQVNRKVRMQFAGPHWYLHSSYCDSWLLVRNRPIETTAWLAAAENLVHFSFSCTFVEGDEVGRYYSFRFLNILKCINIFLKVTNQKMVKDNVHKVI